MTEPGRSLTVEIVAVGKELAQGDVVDTNSAFMASRLIPLGLTVDRHVTVTDELGCVESALAAACERARFVVATGGLGPTEDDLTRHAVAALCGVELELHEPSLTHIEDLFCRRGYEMAACNRVQAMMPRGCRVIPNPVGTAPGFVVDHQGSAIICLPGVPREMKAMLHDAIRCITDAVGALRPGVLRVLNCFGVPESRINEGLAAMMAPGRNPGLGTMACDGIIRLRLLAHAGAAEDAERMLDADEAQIRRCLGSAVFSVGDETLADVVAQELAAAQWTLATAESCTGGLVGHWLTQVPGISQYYRGGVVAYSNEAKTDLLGVPRELFATVGAVSPEVAKAMAAGAAKRLGARVGVGLTGIAGPTGGTPEKPVGLVHVAVALPDRTDHEELRLFGGRVTIKDRAAKAALNMARLALMARRSPPSLR